MPIQYPITINGDLSEMRQGIRDGLADVLDGPALASATEELYRAGRNRVEDVLQQLIDDAAEEFRDDVSVPVDRSTKPPTRSKPGEYPRYDKGAFSASVRPVLFFSGNDRIVAQVAADTPYAGRLNSHDVGGRFYTELTESKWTARVEPRLTISLR